MPPKLTTRGSTTESVAALEAAIQMTYDRKDFYKETGQPYYRPWIVFMTDGEPNPYNESKIAALETRIRQDAKTSVTISKVLVWVRKYPREQSRDLLQAMPNS